MNLKGKMKASLNNQFLPVTWSQNYLGLVVNDSLSLTENCTKSCSKGLSAIFISGDLSEKTNWTTKLNAYTGYVVLILTYVSQAWMPSKMNMEQLEKKATKWILSSNEDYKDSLCTVNFLPFSQYLELHDLLMFIDIINNKFDYHFLLWR